MRVLLFILLCVLLSLAVVPLAAQVDEATEEAPLIAGETTDDGVLVVPTVSDTQDALEVQFAAFAAIIITAIWNLIYIPAAAPLVQLATSIFKRAPFFNTVSSPTLTLSFTILAWIGYIVLTQLGYGDRFNSLITGLTTIVSVIFGIPITQKLAQNIHGFAQANNIPVFGYSRTPGLALSIRNEISDVINKAITDILKPPLTPQRVAVTETVEIPRD